MVDQEILERMSRIEVGRWFKHLGTLSPIERDEAIAIYNCETDVNDNVEGAQEKLDALIKARTERHEYAKLEAEETEKAKAAELLQAEQDATPASDIPDELYHAGRHPKEEA